MKVVVQFGGEVFTALCLQNFPAVQPWPAERHEDLGMTLSILKVPA